MKKHIERPALLLPKGWQQAQSLLVWNEEICMTAIYPADVTWSDVLDLCYYSLILLLVKA